MPLPVGTYTINANGSVGQLVIGSTSTGTINGTVFGQPFTGFFDETEQELRFIRVTSPQLTTFEVFEGTLFSFSPDISHVIDTLAGEFRSYPATGPVTPFLWSAQLIVKLKEKEGKDGKDKEQSKDSKDNKDNKEHKEGKDAGKEHDLPHVATFSDPQSMLAQIERRLNALEQQLAVGLRVHLALRAACRRHEGVGR